jgi:hypothetical protein
VAKNTPPLAKLLGVSVSVFTTAPETFTDPSEVISLSPFASKLTVVPEKLGQFFFSIL